MYGCGVGMMRARTLPMRPLLFSYFIESTRYVCFSLPPPPQKQMQCHEFLLNARGSSVWFCSRHICDGVPMWVDISTYCILSHHVSQQEILVKTLSSTRLEAHAWRPILRLHAVYPCLLDGRTLSVSFVRSYATQLVVPHPQP